MIRFALFFFLAFFLTVPVPAWAGYDEDELPPPSLQDLKNLPKENKFVDDEGAMPIDIREDAQKEAALSYGARGGLAWRTWHIRDELETRARYMDRVFDFRQLVIPAPSGLLIEPPIISEAIDAMIINANGQHRRTVSNGQKSVPDALGQPFADLFRRPHPANGHRALQVFRHVVNRLNGDPRRPALFDSRQSLQRRRSLIRRFRQHQGHLVRRGHNLRIPHWFGCAGA